MNKRITTNILGGLTIPGLYYGILLVFSGASHYLVTEAWRFKFAAISLIGAILWSIVVAIWHKKLYDTGRSKYERALFMFICHPVVMLTVVILFVFLVGGSMW